ncbi:MAG: cation-translocating P-type ATPase [Candidatus Hodarchaeota archaeon]
MSEIRNDYDNFYFHDKDSEAVLAQFDVNAEKGLATSEVSARREKHGSNVLPRAKTSIWKLYLAPFIENTLIVVYLIAGFGLMTISLIFNLGGLQSFILIFVVFNAIMAIFQQVRAQKKLKALKKLTKDTCTVIRGGEKVEVEVSKLVPGDILELNEGDKVAADVRLIKVNNLFINESSISGESIPVAKQDGILEIKSTNIQDLNNYAFMGTFITKGNARGVVVATGKNTEIGKISRDLTEIATQEIPLKRKINNFAKYLGILVCIMFAMTLIYQAIARAHAGSLTFDNFIMDLQLSITTALMFMPVNIPLLITIILYTGVLVLAQKGVIVRNLNSIETLGRVSIVCTDKTGTLTKNEMTIDSLYVDGKVFNVSGKGYSREGSIILDGYEIKSGHGTTLELLVNSGIMNNNAVLVDEKYKVVGGRKKFKQVRNVIGDPMEAALIVLGEKLGVIKKELEKTYSRVKEFPFDSELKRMTSICTISGTSEKKAIVYSKGATEQILDRSTKILESGKENPLTSQSKENLLNRVVEWSEKGYRTLGFAQKSIDISKGLESLDRGEIEKDLCFLGFIMIVDPLREGVKGAIQACESAGAKVKMITGDHPKTAKAIGQELGIYDPDEIIITGDNMNELSDEDFERASIFARVAPGDKEAIISKYQSKKRTVAMTGDGVNDALALGMADVGIAMGISGTDIAKEASDIIISDDSFNTIERGIREGRGLFAKIRVIIYFFVFANLAEALVLFATSFIHPDFNLLTEYQMYAVIAFAHTIPPIGLTFDRMSMDIMKEKPRNEEEIFNKNTLILMIVNIAILIFVMLIGCCLIIPSFDPGLEKVYPNDLMNDAMKRPRTILICVIVIVETLSMLSIRRPNIPIWKSFRKDFGRWYLFMIFIAINALVFHLYFPLKVIPYPLENPQELVTLGEFFGLVPISGEDWLVVLVMSFPWVLALEFTKWILKKVRNAEF